MIAHQPDTSNQTDTPPKQFGPPAVSNELRRIGQFVLQGQLRTGLNRAISLVTNVWVFKVRNKPDAVYCPCCGYEGPGFVSLSNWRAVQHNSRCPGCDSRSRHRGLALLLPGLLQSAPDGPVLVFAPEPALMSHITQNARGAVVTTDYLRTDVDFSGEDIQNLTFADQSFAALTCNHVLEHIVDDRRALQECARVLKPGGVAVFTIPGDYDQISTQIFAQPDANGHLRHYGLDVMDKMRAAFSQVEAINMSVGTDPRWHIHPGDTAFICRK